MYSFPSEVVVTMKKVEDHPSPPKEFWKKMMVAVKDVFFMRNWRRSPGVIFKLLCAM